MVGLAVHTEMGRDEQLVTTLVGELDVATSTQLLEHVHALARPPAVLDCRYLGFVDARGLSTLIALGVAHGVAVVPSSAVQLVVEVCEATNALDLRRADGPPALDRAPFAVAVFDEHARFAYVNEAMASMNGLPAAAHLGHRPREVFDITDGDLTPAIESAIGRGLGFDRVVEATIDDAQLTVRCTIGRVEHDNQLGAVALVRAVRADESFSAPHHHLQFSPAAT